MKTWTNPTVEELDVKLTAALEWDDVEEWFNGKLDGSLIIGGGGNTGSEGGSEGGNEGGTDEGGFGAQS